jgi:hypothetical protein
MTLATAAAIDTASEARSAMYGALARAWEFRPRSSRASPGRRFRDEVAAIAGLLYALGASDIERPAAADDCRCAGRVHWLSMSARAPPCPLCGESGHAAAIDVRRAALYQYFNRNEPTSASRQTTRRSS